ncbi:hypothetical protein K505DRAFT_351801 [Melanomma pulvis-pyrius CBS 109.77]|uniref:Uncharacterized protein n=1 Tax=Melanomma pulvis-pyrius CBS 109.77 TaxID=1314802 RepID=A0A6A6X397_9PLEO|nr:hypothetical protein K505DRAFT_351801 [Melanomma pulvis-pyrius CBS 109.77]
MEYVDGALHCNNPISILLEETKSIWNNRPIGCIVSIGTGKPVVGGVGKRGPDILKALVKMATDTENTAREFKIRISQIPETDRPKYYRFNVERGLESIALEEWTQFQKLTEATTLYLNDQREEIEACAGALFSAVEWNEDERKCQQALSAVDYQRHKERNPNRVKGTCRWFLKHPNFEDWQRSNVSSLLWVSADPGCGKSVLSKSLVDIDLRATASRTTCYFFFKDDDATQKSPTSALSALLHQLFLQKKFLIHHAIPSYQSHGSNLVQKFHELWGVLIKAASDPKAGEVVCILDALDECEGSGQKEIITALNNYYTNDFKQTPSKLKFLVTSRPYLDIERQFNQLTGNIPTVRLRGEEESEEISNEINHVIKWSVQKLGSELSLTKEEQSTLQEELLRMTHRTYLWLKLILDVIRNEIGPTKKRLREIAYEAILSKVSDKKRARKLLCIVVAAARPLTLKEMNIALAIEDDYRSFQDLDLDFDNEKRLEDTVRHTCGLFVSVIDQNVYLIHQTAKEFLLAQTETCSEGWKYSIEPAESDLVIARTCITYLLFTEFYSNSDTIRELQALKKKHHFLSYAASQWATHFRKAQLRVDDGILQSCLDTCDTQSERYQFWFFIYWTSVHGYRSSPPQFTSIIMVGSYFGHEDVVKLLLATGKAEVNSKDSKGRTPLFGNEAVVKLLLATGKVEVNSKDSKGNAEVNSKDSNGRTPLSWAAEYGCEAGVKLLLATGKAEVDSKDFNGWTPLLWAAKNGREVIVKLLLATGKAEVNSKDSNGRTPLSWAAENGHKAVIELLQSFKSK